MKKQERPLKLGVARCLLGDNVRYDGSHKLNRYLRDVLGEFVEFVPVCPEVECGMSIPREAVRLVGDVDSPRLVGRGSGHDFTDQMQQWGNKRLAALEDEDICGYVFKYGSPSSGMARIKVWQENGQPRYDGVGMWARMVMDHFPDLPFEDDGRLNDPVLRENFITRVFTLKRWRDMLAEGMTRGALVEFHTCHKLLILAHHEKTYREMGPYVAGNTELSMPEFFKGYHDLLTKALSYKTTTKKNVNVLTHALGYFKKQLSADEKQEMLELINQYAEGLVPLIVPVTLINHYVRKYDQPYLSKQWYLNPHPAELKLRNHV